MVCHRRVGLNKFDGIRFLTYYKEETTGKQKSITGNELNCLLTIPSTPSYG